ncbi:MAG: BamA/TamA family outer membrane protein [Bacteroidota bacterium]
MERHPAAPCPRLLSGPFLLLSWLLLVFPCYLFAQSSDSLSITEIEIRGAQRTKNWIILQEMSLQEGQNIGRSELDAHLRQSQQNLYNLNLFHSLEVTSTFLNDSSVSVLIKVLERGLIAGSPYLDIQERNTYDLIQALRVRNFRRAVIGGDFQLVNFMGRNETLRLFAQVGFSQVVSLRFSRPTLSRKRQLDLELNARYRNEHEIIIGTEQGKVRWQSLEATPMQRSWDFSAKLGKRLSLYKRASIQLGYQTFQIADSVGKLEVGGQIPRLITQLTGREFYPTLAFSLHEDRRDWHTFPQKGYKWQMQARFAGPKPIASTQFASFGFSWVHHLPIGKRWNFTYGTQQLLTLGDSIPYFEKHFIGMYRPQFANLSYELRGYDPYAIDGTFIHMSKVEGKFALFPIQQLRLPFIPLRRFQRFPFGIFATAFCDIGYVRDGSFNNLDPHWKDQWLVGYGPGLNMVMFFDLLFRVEYAWNRQGDGGLYFNAILPIK